MQIHRLVTFAVSTVLHEARVSTFDLNTAARFLLDMLYVGTSMADDLSAKIEARNWFEIDGYTLFRPFASSKLVALHLLGLPPSEASLVYEIGELLLHEFVDLLDGKLKAIFRRACNMEIERWILQDYEYAIAVGIGGSLTAAVAMLLSG